MAEDPRASREEADPGQAAQSDARQVGRSPSASVLDELLRDPLLRHDEQGQRLLRLLQHNAVDAQELAGLIGAVPPQSAATVVLLARQFAQMWLHLAQELDERANDQ